MAQFKRGLSQECADALRQLAEERGENWWKDVLASGKLLLAVRDQYLNAYANGQSVFKIGYKKGLRVDVHYKYLIEPTMKAGTPYVRFDGKNFKIDPSTAVRTTYDSKETLSRVIQTALTYSGAEKAGVHQIAERELKVVDLEIAFARSGDLGKRSTAPRMDLAVLIPARDGARLVFCEAKCADNAELWMPSKDKRATGEIPIAVVAQLRKYETFIRENADALVTAYRRVCQTLMDLHEQGWRRKRDDLVGDVAKGLNLRIHPNVYLLVYGFDSKQRNAVSQRLDALGKGGLLRSQIIEKGDADQFRLETDIERSASE